MATAISMLTARAKAWRRCGPALLIAALLGLAIAPAQAQTPSRPDHVPGGPASLAGIDPAADLALGRRIYLEGIGAQDQPISGRRMGLMESRGASVACVQCHRRSGLGAVEGSEQVPPIAGRFILEDESRAVVSLNYRTVKSFNQRHAPYSVETLTAALTLGLHATGRELGALMPRYEFSATEVRALAAYLRTLSAQWSPGVSATRLRLATVITPEVGAARRERFLATTRAALNSRNGNVSPGRRTMNAGEMMLNTQRHWDLDVWSLEGAPDTWAAQLDALQRAQPVFALVSGLGEGTWEPVQAFCERAAVPCWFPSVPAPPARAAGDFYGVYFSRGVALEAEVLAQHWASLAPAQRPRRVLQIHGGDAAARAGAAALRAALAAPAAGAQPISVDERVLDALTPAGLTAARSRLAALGAGDAVMLWLRPDAAAAIATLPLPAVPTHWSGTLAQGERLGTDLPADWRAGARLVYPYQLPEARRTGLFYFKTWLQVRNLPLQEELMQSEVYFAWSYLAETLTELLDNLHGDYLVERAENMLSLREAAKAEDEAREATTAKHQARGGTQAALARLELPPDTRLPRPLPQRAALAGAAGSTASGATPKRESTTIYPRLGLAPGQRFASKGACIVRFAPDVDGMPPGLVAVTDWLTP